MTSQIDPTKPTNTNALTGDVRSNFGFAKSEIEALQNAVAEVSGGPFLKLSGGQLSGVLTLAADPVGDLDAASKRWVEANAATQAPVHTVAGRIGDVLLSHFDITDWAAVTASLTPNYANIIGGLGFVPYDQANPAHYQTDAQLAAAVALLYPITNPAHYQTDVQLAAAIAPLYPAANPANYQTDTQVAFTVNAAVIGYVPLGQKGAVNGVATLDATGVIPTAQLPGAVTGTPSYQGAWNASANSPVLANGALAGGVLQPKGNYFLVSVSGTTSVDGGAVWTAGDWISSNGSVWQRVQNSTSPYLPLVGGNLGGPLGLADGSILRAGSSMMPDLAYWITGAAGNIPFALDTTGLVMAQRLQVFGQTFLAGLSVSGGLSEVGDLSVTGNLSVTGTGSFTGMLAPAAITFPNADVEQLGNSAMPDLARWVRDTTGNIIFGFSSTGDTIVNNLQVIGTLSAPGFVGGGGGDDPNSFSASLIDARDARATANSMAVKGQSNSQIAQPIWTHNMVLIYGQSLSVGNQGLPRMSTNEGLDNLTLGLAPGGVQTSTDYVFIPDTNSLINPLDGTRGYETPGISATNQWRALQLQWRDLATDPTRRLIVNGCGEGGKAIEELSKGYASPCYYDRIPSLLNQVKAAVTAASGSNTFGVCAVYYLQGEANYGAGWDNTTAGYQAKWEQLRSDITADIKAITGQKLAPAFFASQPNSEWDNVLQQNTIAMAFINACTTPPLGDFLCMPNYAAPNSNPNGPHMSPDGYRYMGNGAGKIMHRVFDRGEGWLPLYPTKITYRGKQFLLECHTPEPPLQTQPFYGGTDGSTVQPILTDLGFSCGDSLGALNITSIKLYNSCILINCDRTIATGGWVDYANKAHNGNGNICDSDPFLSLDTFGTLPVAMIGKPYPSWNWMVAFRITAVSDV